MAGGLPRAFSDNPRSTKIWSFHIIKETRFIFRPHIAEPDNPAKNSWFFENFENILLIMTQKIIGIYIFPSRRRHAPVIHIHQALSLA